MDIIDFEDIRPYNDNEVHQILQKVIHSDYFLNACRFAFPNVDVSVIKQKLQNINTVKEFQIDIMSDFMINKIKQTSSSLTFSGFEKLNKNQPNLFISNHRDIVLDSAILQILLTQHDLETSEIAIGSNLMKYPFLDIVRLNKMFKIERSGKSRELLNILIFTSQYIRFVLTQKKNSIWIAQRNGRSKDGNDITDTAVLKMLASSGENSFIENLYKLNITPLAISYEYEPCDFMRTNELHISKSCEYKKSYHEDFDNIYQGISQWKGQIHLSICDSLTKDELKQCDSLSERNEKFRHLAHIIDNKIYKNYKLYKTNYIAYDELIKSSKFKNFYSEEEKQEFFNYAKSGLQKVKGNQADLLNIFLEIYANPVKNYLK